MQDSLFVSDNYFAMQFQSLVFVYAYHLNVFITHLTRQVLSVYEEYSPSLFSCLCNTLRRCLGMCVCDTLAMPISQFEAMSPLSYCSLLLLLLSMSPASGVENSLSAAEKQELLDVHNYLRSTAVPPATNMERMVSSLREYTRNHIQGSLHKGTDSNVL